jgi:hypothetical protein
MHFDLKLIQFTWLIPADYILDKRFFLYYPYSRVIHKV